MHLRGVLKDNSNNQYREQILYYTAMSSYKFAQMSVPEKQKERYMAYVDDYYNFVSEYPDVVERKVLDDSFVKARKIAGLKEMTQRWLQKHKVRRIRKLEGVVPKTKVKIKADRRSAKQAIKDAKKAVRIEESKNSVALGVSDDKALVKQKKAEQRKIDKDNREDVKAAKKIEREEKAAAKKAAKEKTATEETPVAEKKLNNK